MGARADDVEIPELRVAYAAEKAAVDRIRDMQGRLAQARGAVLLRRQDRGAVASRAARGEDVTGADLRRADEALAEAEATVALLTDALPRAGQEAQEAAKARWRAEHGAELEKRRRFIEAHEAAEVALKAAQEAHDRALADRQRLPAAVQAELDALLDRHGRDAAVARATEEITRIEVVNWRRKDMGQELMQWPPALAA